MVDEDTALYACPKSLDVSIEVYAKNGGTTLNLARITDKHINSKFYKLTEVTSEEDLSEFADHVAIDKHCVDLHSTTEDLFLAHAYFTDGGVLDYIAAAGPHFAYRVYIAELFIEEE